MMSLLLSVLFAFPTNHYSILTIQRVEAAPIVLNSTTTIAAYVKVAQLEYGLSNDFYETLQHESDGFQNTQSNVVNLKGPNGREDSWGIAQIHLPAHPEISKEQALDPKWSIDWAAFQFSEGHQDMWTYWNNNFAPVSR